MYSYRLFIIVIYYLHLLQKSIIFLYGKYCIMNIKTHESLIIYGPSIASSFIISFILLGIKWLYYDSLSWFIVTAPLWFFPVLFLFLMCAWGILISFGLCLAAINGFFIDLFFKHRK